MDDLLTIRQAAIILKVHSLTVRRYVKEGKLKAIKVGGNVRIAHAEIINFGNNYIAHTKTTSKATNSAILPLQPFTFEDSLFRLKGRGLSLDNLK